MNTYIENEALMAREILKRPGCRQALARLGKRGIDRKKLLRYSIVFAIAAKVEPELRNKARRAQRKAAPGLSWTRIQNFPKKLVSVAKEMEEISSILGLVCKRDVGTLRQRANAAGLPDRIREYAQFLKSSAPELQRGGILWTRFSPSKYRLSLLREFCSDRVPYKFWDDLALLATSALQVLGVDDQIHPDTLRKECQRKIRQ